MPTHSEEGRVHLLPWELPLNLVLALLLAPLLAPLERVRLHEESVG